MVHLAIILYALRLKKIGLHIHETQLETHEVIAVGTAYFIRQFDRG